MFALFVALALQNAAAPQTPQMPSAASNQQIQGGTQNALPAKPARPLPKVDDLADGFAKLRAAAEAKKLDEALGWGDAMLAPNGWQSLRTKWETDHAWTRAGFELAEPLVSVAGFGGPTEVVRGEIHYAEGVALALSEQDVEAAAHFRTALALGGPGDLRLDAGYDVASLALGEAEHARSEMQQQSQQPQPPNASLAQPSTATKDPLTELEGRYRAAKELFLDRLRADWRDVDTRANLELIQRRLREIQKQRQEQEKHDEQKNQQQQKNDQKDPKDQKDQKDQQKQDQKDQQKDDQQKQQDSKDDQKSKDQQKQDSKQQNEDQKSNDDSKKDPKDQQQSDAEKKSDEQKKQDAEQKSKDEKKSKDSKDAEAAKPGEERVLSREELMRLFDQLEKIDKEGKALEARIRQKRRAKTAKDW